MLAALEGDGTTRTVLVHKQDRAARNLTDWATLTERLGATVIAVDEPTADTPQGRLVQVFGIGLAKLYSENLSREVKKGMRGKFEAGGCTYTAPVGYRNVPRTRTAPATVVVDEVMAPVVRLMFERYATGKYSLQALALEMSELGIRSSRGKPLSSYRISRRLADTFYIGEVKYAGESLPGAHTPIVSLPLFEAVQAQLRRRSTDPGTKGSRSFLLRGLLWCGTCGRPLSAEDHPRGSYYRCLPDVNGRRCVAPYIRVRDLDARVEALLPDIQLRHDQKAELVSALARMGEEHQATHERERRLAQRRLAELDGQLTRLTEGYTACAVPLDQYRSLATRLDADLRRARVGLAALDRDLAPDIAALTTILETATALAHFYALCTTMEERKELLRRVFARITLIDRTITTIEYHPPFHLLLGETAREGSRVDLERRVLNYLASGGLEGTSPQQAA